MIKKNFVLLSLSSILIIQLIFYYKILSTNINIIDSSNNSNSNYKTTNRTIEYVKNIPLVMLRYSLDKDVLNRFQQIDMFSCNENNLNSFNGLENRVKIPIYIYEGYYHSLPTHNTVYSRNPNPQIAIDFNKPAADRFLRAYYETFRRINEVIFSKLKKDLIDSANIRHSSNPESDVCFEFSKFIDKNYIAGDLSVQIHYGENNNAKFNSAWHTDALNSLLHMAITIRGRRVLHSFRSNSSDGLLEERLEEQLPGVIYLSSSTLMKHAPQFFDTNYDNRVIAIHARILYTTEEMKSFYQKISNDGWKSLTKIIAEFLSTSDIKFPNFQQITTTEHEMI